MTFEAFRKLVILKAGHYDEVFLKSTGEYIQIPKSISFDDMTEDEFEEFYSDTIDAILTYILPTWERSDLTRIEDEVLSYGS